MKSLAEVKEMKKKLQSLDDTHLEEVINHYEEILRNATEMFNSNIFVGTALVEIRDSKEMLALLYQENCSRHPE